MTISVTEDFISQCSTNDGTFEDLSNDLMDIHTSILSYLTHNIDNDFYDINSYRYGNAANGAVESRTLGYTINGYHPFIRLKFEANVGNIVTILAR